MGLPKATPQEKIKALCAEVNSETFQSFIQAMDQDYFSYFSPKEISEHIKKLDHLSPQNPILSQVKKQGGQHFDITILALDTFSVFSMICGLLASFGLDIQAGHSYTIRFKPSLRQTPPSRFRRPLKKEQAGHASSSRIVDIFTVRPKTDKRFDQNRRTEFQNDLQSLTVLLGNNQVVKVQEHLSRRLTEQLEKDVSSNPFYPIDVRFDNRRSHQWTLMQVYSTDVPAFLYAFSNALAIRNIYIHKVKIQNVDSKVYDEFYISDRNGRKIEGVQEQENLKMAAVLIKQFTHFLSQAPDPAKSIRYFDQFLDKLFKEKKRGSSVSFLKHKERLSLLARLLGTSDFLWEDFFRMQFENLLPILEHFKLGQGRSQKESLRKTVKGQLSKVSAWEDKKKALNNFKDREIFLIDMHHLVQSRASLSDFSESLTDLTEVVLEQVYQECLKRLTRKYGTPRLKNGTPCAFSICGLGKFGGREMGYASDIELLFLYEGSGSTLGKKSIDNDSFFEELALTLTDFIESKQEGIFHIDLRLRPWGRTSPLINSISQLMSYYDPKGDAALFERQALIKLRWVAGDRILGEKMEAFRDHFVYSSEPWDRKVALHLRHRQIRELVKTGSINVKHSPGGIIDIEYATQYLQIERGAMDPRLRTPNTLRALGQLNLSGVFSDRDYQILHDAYIFLRTLIDALRIVRANAKDLILPDTGTKEFKFLARRLGYSGQDWAKGAEELDQDIKRHMEGAHRFFIKRFEPEKTQ